VIGRDRGSKDRAIKNLDREDEGGRESESFRFTFAERSLGFEDVIISEREDAEILGRSSWGFSIGKAAASLCEPLEGVVERRADCLGIFEPRLSRIRRSAEDSRIVILCRHSLAVSLLSLSLSLR